MELSYKCPRAAGLPIGRQPARDCRIPGPLETYAGPMHRRKYQIRQDENQLWR